MSDSDDPMDFFNINKKKKKVNLSLVLLIILRCLIFFFNGITFFKWNCRIISFVIFGSFVLFKESLRFL